MLNMRRIALMGWWLFAVSAAVDISPVIMEIDLVFPRNDTYATAPLTPIVFAFRNAALAPYLNPTISFSIWNLNDMGNDVLTMTYDVRWANFSDSEPYFAYRGFDKFAAEGDWMLKYTIGWDGCDEEAVNSLDRGAETIVRNRTTQGVRFATRKGGREVDLVAASKDKETCDEKAGIAVNVTKILTAPDGVDWIGRTEKCAAVELSPSPTPDPCRIEIDTAAASSISAAVTSWRCDVPSPADFCPPVEESIAWKWGVAGAACLAAGLGAVGFVLV